MAGLLATLTSIAAAGTLMVSSAVNEAAPQNDPDGIFLVNRQWRIKIGRASCRERV